MKYSAESVPIPWRIDHDLSKYDINPMYAKDPFGRDMWPSNGFIDDFQAYTLGYETSNFITFWTAIHGISSTVQRKAYLRFGDGLYPNFFIIIVAPPAVVHKSTALHRFDGIERVMWDSFKNEATLKLYKPDVIRSKATPEQLFEHMKNISLNVEGVDIESDAVLIIRVSELTTFLGKAQYLQGLIDKITDFYDCKDVDTDSTIARGSQELQRVFTSLFGCTTPDSFKASIPETAFGGGFMSRCTIVQEFYTNRIIPFPYYPKESPNREELAERLKWIWQNKRGEYKISNEAYEAYKKWYYQDALKKRKAALEPNADHREGRKSDIVLKLATALAVQRYDLKREVTLEDFECALKIVDFTNESSIGLIEDVAVESQEDGRFMKFRRILKEHPAGLSRQILARKHGFKKEEIDKFIVELKERGEYTKAENKIKFKGGR